jgi:hypothetical protein
MQVDRHISAEMAKWRIGDETDKGGMRILKSPYLLQSSTAKPHHSSRRINVNVVA